LGRNLPDAEFRGSASAALAALDMTAPFSGYGIYRSLQLLTKNPDGVLRLGGRVSAFRGISSRATMPTVCLVLLAGMAGAKPAGAAPITRVAVTAGLCTAPRCPQAMNQPVG
jgi:hypothetical protein